LAAAGLRRLGLLNHDTGAVEGVPLTLLGFEEMLPAAGQGALAIEARSDAPGWLLDAVAAISDAASLAEVSAERALLAILEAGCLAPVGVLAQTDHRPAAALGGPELTLSAVIAQHLTHQRVQLFRHAASGAATDALRLGDAVGRQLLMIVAPANNGAEWLADVRAGRDERV